MITTCSGCQTRYQLEDTKVPSRVIRVRCPKCSTVFQLDGAAHGTPDPVAGFESYSTPEAPPPESSSPESQAGGPSSDEVGGPAAAAVDKELVTTPPTEEPRCSVEPATESAAEPVVELASESVTETAVALEDPPSPTRRRGRDKARMLARALVSDIMVYNQTARDKALADGNLLEALGPEIKKSWELYKGKVGADVANDTTHFRDALNEILADGKKVF